MSKIWAITSYFNPVGYSHRLENYRMFQKHLGIPLATAEISYSGEFALEQTDADILLQFCSKDVMWQKERLLNLLVQKLPKTCEYVAWIDCDVIFESRNWAPAAIEALEQFGLIHLYDHRVNLPRDTLPDDESGIISANSPQPRIPSAIFLMQQGRANDEDLVDAATPVKSRSTVGLAWASSRHVLETCRLYDACIIGGADRAILGAALGRFGLGTQALKMHGPQKEHYLSWASKFHDAIGGKVGHISGLAFHLWHGALENRQYVSRLDLLNAQSFNPYTDILLDGHGLWQWSSAKQQLHESVRLYFASRMEDG